MGTDWQETQHRFLVHFADGGSGMRSYDEPLAVGEEISDGGTRYRFVGGISALAGVLMLWLLLGAASTTDAAAAAGASAAAVSSRVEPVSPALDRRRFVGLAFAAVVVAGGLGTFGGHLLSGGA